jgi:hypothetical protein
MFKVRPATLKPVGISTRQRAIGIALGLLIYATPIIEAGAPTIQMFDAGGRAWLACIEPQIVYWDNHPDQYAFQVAPCNGHTP